MTPASRSPLVVTAAEVATRQIAIDNPDLHRIAFACIAARDNTDHNTLVADHAAYTPNGTSRQRV